MHNFNRKLLIGILAIMLAFLPVLGGAMVSLLRVIAAEDRLISGYSEQLLLAKDLREQEIAITAMMPAFVLTGHQDILNQIDGANRAFGATLARLYAMDATAAGRRQLNAIQDLNARMTQIGLTGIAMKEKGISTADVNTYFEANAKDRMRAILRALGNYVEDTNALYHREIAHNTRGFDIIVRVLAGAIAMAVFFSAVVAALLLKLIRQKRLQETIDEKLHKRERQLSMARKETVEVVAHDLKNPLSSILLSVDLLRRKLGGQASADIARMLEIIASSAQTMKALIDGLLDHAKIESGTMALSRRPCDLDRLLHGLTARFEPIAGSKKIALGCDIAADLPTVPADIMRIEQVISNLLGNALKFTPAQGAVSLRAHLENERVIVAVQDNGPGMSEEETEHVFERYWQARETAGQGTGLGLAICHAIMKAHDGGLWLDSAPGKGSTFYLSIPVAETRPAKLRDGHALPSRHAANGR